MSGKSSLWVRTNITHWVFLVYICIEILGEYKCCWYSVFFPATARICPSSVLRHYCSRLCEEKFPRERCVNHVTSYAYLIKEPLDALSAAIWPCSRWKKIPVTSFVCRQNHFSRLIRHQTNNYCYFLLDWFFVSVALMPSGKPFLKVAKKIPRQPTTRVEVNLIRVLISNWHTERIMEGMKSVFLGGRKGRWGG